MVTVQTEYAGSIEYGTSKIDAFEPVRKAVKKNGKALLDNFTNDVKKQVDDVLRDQ